MSQGAATHPARPALPDLRYDLLIFDWDGTVIDSIGTIVDCAMETFRDLGLEGVDEEAIRHTIGMGLKETLQEILPEADLDTTRQVRELYYKHWKERHHHRPQAFTGAGETLEALRASGYRLAVATGKSRRGLDLDFGRTGLGSHFEATRTADETACKPDPTMVLELLEELAVPAARSLMVGDTTYDLRLAENAGIASVALTSGSQPRHLLETESPLAYLDTLTELPGWLGSSR